MAQQRRHHTHAHYLSYVIPPYEHGWKCDICGTSGGKTQVWHCHPCSYDLCNNCIRPAEVQSPLSVVPDFDESAFRTRVNNAVERARTILENTRAPTFASDVHHEYEDKFLLAEYIANTTVASLLQALEFIGLSDKIYAQMREWARNRTVTLRLKAEETCKFLRKTTREVESDTKHVHTSTIFGKTESYTVTKITEWFWAFEAKYELIAFMGNEPEKAVTLCSRTGGAELKTTSETTPRPASVVQPNLDINITWLLAQFDEGASRAPCFAINRGAKSCHTPRRNAEVDAALSFLVAFFNWSRSVFAYFTDMWRVDPDHGLDLSGVRDTGLFVPVVPLFEKNKVKDEAPGSGVVPIAYIGPFLGEQKRTINERFMDAAKTFPAPANDKLISVTEARLLCIMLHLQKICSAFSEGVDSIENMLWRQLVAAIGKEVHPLDFANYMRFHNRKLFRGEFMPLPFSYAIRREGHDPEGTLSIEAAPTDGSIAEPIQTIVRHAAANARQMKFALDASTEVRFGGNRYLHGYISTQFGGEAAATLSLRARARQFSSYIVMVGAIASADLFIPKYGILVQNKDELKIPLNLETIPTPKEFKDAIESLSPEQQRFAKAFRGMQLESTLFGVLVIQIKPQLERLLNLPPDALTKEIQLAQDLQTLFIEYQMPSDLLSYDGVAEAPLAKKVERVKQLCAVMMGTINKEKAAQLEQARLAQELRLAEERKRQEEERARRTLREEEERQVVEPNMMMTYKSSSSSTSSGKGFLSAVGNIVSRATSPRSSAPRVESSARVADMAVPMPAAMPSPVAPAPSPAAPNTSSVAPAAPPADGGGAAPQPVDSKPEVASEKPKLDSGEKGKEPSTQKTGELIEAEAEDYTKVPQELERKYETLDEDSALRPTIISAGNVWTKRSCKSLLSPPADSSLSKEEQGKERNRAFDLLDALTKSGAMTIAEADLHVVIAATHCFEKSVMNTVVQDNINPIEKVERSALIVATSVHRRPAIQLIQEEQVQRVGLYSPKLVDAAAIAQAAAASQIPQLSSAALEPIKK